MNEINEDIGAAFRALAAEWHLTNMEAALLLGVEGGALGLDLAPRQPTPETRERMRLLTELRKRLPHVFPCNDEIRRWLRTFDRQDESPIVFMSHGLPHIAAMIDAVDAQAARDGAPS